MKYDDDSMGYFYRPAVMLTIIVLAVITGIVGFGIGCGLAEIFKSEVLSGRVRSLAQPTATPSGD